MPQQPQEASPDGDIGVRIDPDVRVDPEPASPVVAEQPHDDTLAALAGQGPLATYEPEVGPPAEVKQAIETRRAGDDSPADQSPADALPDDDSADDDSAADPLPADDSPADSRGAAIQADSLAAGRRAAAQAQAIEASRRAAALANAARAESAPGDRDDAEAAALHGDRRPSRDTRTDADAGIKADADDTADIAPVPEAVAAPRPVSPAPDLLPGFDRSDAPHTRRSRPDGPAAALTRTRRPAVGLTALVVFGLVALFFGWVSADPFWLAVGRGAEGTVTVTQCDSGQCVGTFEGQFRADGVALSGVSPTEREPGATVPGRMLASDRTWAYTGPAWALHLRWALGLAVALLCGVAVAVSTGARFLRPLGRRAAVGGRVLAVAGPLLLFAGMLGAALL